MPFPRPRGELYPRAARDRGRRQRAAPAPHSSLQDLPATSARHPAQLSAQLAPPALDDGELSAAAPTIPLPPKPPSEAVSRGARGQRSRSGSAPSSTLAGRRVGAGWAPRNAATLSSPRAARRRPFRRTALSTQGQAFLSPDGYRSLRVSAKYNPAPHPALDPQRVVKGPEPRQQSSADLARTRPRAEPAAGHSRSHPRTHPYLRRASFTEDVPEAQGLISSSCNDGLPIRGHCLRPRESNL